MGSSPSQKQKDSDKKPVYKQAWFWSTIIIVIFVFGIALAYYYRYTIREQSLKDYELIFKYKDELMDLYEQYWEVTGKMKKVLQKANSTIMTLDDFLYYLRRIETGKVCRNNLYRSRIPELENYCSGLK